MQSTAKGFSKMIAKLVRNGKRVVPITSISKNRTHSKNVGKINNKKKMRIEVSVYAMDPSGDHRLKGAWPWDSTKLNLCLQSPVNIQESSATKSEFEPLTITIPNDPCLEFSIKKSGQEVKISLEDPKAKRMSMSGGFLQDCYCLDNIHFHWGETSELGSEHFVNGESYAGEIHLVTYKKEYKNFDTAIQNEDGVVVVCFFLELGEKNEKLETLLPSIAKTNEEKCGVKCSGTDLMYWFLPELSKSNCTYFTYPGSLTAPPFTEIITFVVLSSPLPVSDEQMGVFRTLVDEQEQPILSNRREIQPLKERPILCGGQINWNLNTGC